MAHSDFRYHFCPIDDAGQKTCELDFECKCATDRGKAICTSDTVSILFECAARISLKNADCNLLETIENLIVRLDRLL